MYREICMNGTAKSFMCFKLAALYFIFSTTTVTAMRLVLQRVKSASVRVERETISSIGPGIMALVGLHENDTVDNLKDCCRKLLAAKLWENDNGGMWRHGVKQRSLEVLCVSQFTLYGTLSKKNQPDYKLAMKATPAAALYAQFLTMLKEMKKIRYLMGSLEL